MAELLEVKNLSVSFHARQGEVQAVRDVSFSLKSGEVLAVVGESGCGKSVLLKCMMKLLPDSAYIKSGRIIVNGSDITDYREREMRRLRGKLFSMVFQNPLTFLNPTLTVGRQIAEAVRIHNPAMAKEDVHQRVLELMRLTGIREPQEQYGRYPYQFSGGMRQRSVLAIALACGPKILFADEPTTALDVTIQAQILDLMREILLKTHTAMLLVSHDLGVVARTADRVAVMRTGKIVEIGTAEEIFYAPRHPYTQELLRAHPAGAKDGKISAPVLLDVQSLSHDFLIKDSKMKKTAVRAVNNISFQIQKGEIFGLAGESGCGKSTLARCIMNIYQPSSGAVYYNGINVCDAGQRRRHKKMLQASRQMIFQDFASSLNPRMKAADIIAEPMVIHHMVPKRGSYRAEAAYWLQCTGMDASYLDRYPPELSGGMCQRVAIARALCMEPELLVADEPAASLDMPMQAQILQLFRHLQQEHGFTFLFITHDLSVIRYLCDRAGVMYQGNMVEAAPVEELFANPLHPYTKALLSAVPVPDPVLERRRKPYVFHEGEFLEGAVREVSPGHFVYIAI